MDQHFEYKEVDIGLPTERVLDVAAAVANLVPLIGSPVSSIISGISGERKEQRILEVVQGVSDDLRDFQSYAAEQYVKTEEFEELLEGTLKRVAQERSSKKRALYGRILTHAIKHPGGDYDEQIWVVKTLEELDTSHIVILRSLRQSPEQDLGIMGSPMQTLQRRSPEFTEVQIESLVNDLNERRITSVSSLHAMMTAYGAADLQHMITENGRSVLKYLEGA